MKSRNIKTRLAAFGLALLMGLSPLGNLADVHAAESEISQNAVTEKESKTESEHPVSEISEQTVTAEDITKDVSDKEFMAETCMEGIQYDPEKEDVTLEHIEAEDGSAYHPDQAGTYVATYWVVPKDARASYSVTRKIILTDTEGQAHAEENGGQKQKEDTKSEEDSETPVQEIPDVEVTVSGEDADAQAARELEEKIEDGEVMMFSGAENTFTARETVHLEKGETIYYPSYIGNYLTCWFTVNGKIAYCLESHRSSPPSGDYVAQVLDSNKNLQKVLYYGYGGAGDITGSYLSGKSAEEKYVYTHIAASYAYAGEAGFTGCKYEDLVKAGVIAYIDHLFAMEEPPKGEISLSKTSVKAVRDGNVQKTPDITLSGDHRNYISVNVPKDITIYNKTKGTSAENGALKIYGGDTFYLTAPMLYTGTYSSGELHGSVGETWRTLVLSTGNSNQDIGVFESEKANPVSFTVDWLEMTRIELLKKDADTKNPLDGAVYGIYTDRKCEHLLMEMPATGEDGKAVFDVDLPFSTYYIKELAAPAGYVSSFETLEVTAKYQGQDVKMVELESVFKNQPTKVTFTKSDITTGVELSGATLTVLDKDGNVVDTWKSVKGEEHLIERLTAGETYTLREEMAPYGYLMAEEVSFTVDDTAEIQKVEMKDAVPTGTLIINKKGEFLEKISALDSIGGWMKHLFEYLSGSLKDVTFEVYALEDIKAADGESEDYYKKDALVATITTDETGVAKLTDLPLGKYCVKEKETANGYVLDGEAREVDLTYRDQNTAVVTYSADWQNKRQRAEVNVLKKEKDSDRVLEGAVFALCNKENIVNAKGDVILKADTVIEEQATDKEGKLTFTADLPLGYTYYVKETSPAPGFATTDQVQEFTFEYGGADKETLSYVFTFEDEPTTVEFTKTSLTDGKEIEGAKLKVTDESGNTVDEWTSGKEPHIIKELTAGKKYTMTETLPADGYVTAESITFTVEDTGEVQKVEMKDDVTKVQISKTDIYGKELPGAKLTILDKDGKTVESWTSEKKPHYIEMLPIGKYTLREETAPDGYLVAEDVKFTVKDTGEIQKVVMKDEAKPEETPTETPTETPETTSTPETKTTEETKKSTSPKTGDNTPILFWILLAGAGMAGLGGTVILRKKKK